MQNLLIKINGGRFDIKPAPVNLRRLAHQYDTDASIPTHPREAGQQANVCADGELSDHLRDLYLLQA